MRRRVLVALLFWQLIGGSRGLSDTTAGPSPIAIAAFPPNIHLSDNRDRQSIVVQASYADGTTRDVTNDAVLTLSQSEFSRISGRTLEPVADGMCDLIVEYDGHRQVLPVVVQGSTIDKPISFQLDVMPVLMRTGCNTGSCHGAARGKDGFRLSLFGFDPAGDYHRLTREVSGRRVNLALPASSLLIEKGAGLVPHTGGKRFELDSQYAQTLLRWLQAGAPNDAGEVPKVTKVEIFPDGAVLDGQGATQQFNVRALYSDGTDRDVTSLAVFMTNNDNSAPVDAAGTVTAASRGEAFIMARFETHTVGQHVIALPKGLQFSWQEAVVNNYIDELMHEKFKKLRIQPSNICSDEEFLRRVSLDITGTVPTAEEYHVFVADSDLQKRNKKVDELLTRKEFVEIWVMKWAELLQVRTTQQIAYKPMLRYYNWIQEQIANNVPMNVMVQELLGASGGTFENAATNYYQQVIDPLKVSENVAQVFLGMRLQCAQCHNHPFDRWTMDDYYSFAAFFAQVGRKQGEDPREQIVFNSGSGEVGHLVGGRAMAPKFLGGATANVAGKDRRVVLAEWLASPENPYFATNLANIVWNHFFGKGIINEVDDVRVSNPPVNAELLETLGKKFTEYNYDFKSLVRDICTSATYQLSTTANETNATDEVNFSHAYLRRVRAEVLLDVISQVTETKNKFGGLPLGARAVQIANGNTSTYFLTTFGRATRESVCACEVKIEPNLSQALHLLNGETVHGKVTEGNVIGRALESGQKPDEVITNLYIRTLTRRPTEKELQDLLAVVAEAEHPKTALEDIFWSLLNSREFVFNH